MKKRKQQRFNAAFEALKPETADPDMPDEAMPGYLSLADAIEKVLAVGTHSGPLPEPEAVLLVLKMATQVLHTVAHASMDERDPAERPTWERLAREGAEAGWRAMQEWRRMQWREGKCIEIQAQIMAISYVLRAVVPMFEIVAEQARARHEQPEARADLN